MKSIFTLFLLVVIFLDYSYAQLPPACADTSCSFTQVLCASSQANGCVGEAYSQIITLAVPSTIPAGTSTLPLTNIKLISLTGLPPGIDSSCTPSNCIFNGGLRGCLSLTGIPTAAGSYPLTAYVRITIALFIIKDTVFSAGTIVIDPVCLVNISGKIISEKGDSIPGVIVSLSGSDTQKDTTGINGFYSFNVPKGGSYVITPAKNNDAAKTNGISAIDLALMQKHILIIDTLDSPYKIIAADVNSTNSVSAADIGLAKRVILSVDTTFPGSKLWTFVKSDYVFTDPINLSLVEKTRTLNNVLVNQTNLDFIGVKLGDVNGNWNPLIP